ncbi:mucin-binding protein [Lacticaseibacillus hulanensis]|uniref:mucin-binding protein n=1 Tax=Lacticaseibacillus hulanensis TaxID=2493111 RepID=UPI000FDC35CB|nr:LPXTG cell wall anchor domain-containing protein [Lacticaseibacillus hulanensis]
MDAKQQDRLCRRCGTDLSGAGYTVVPATITAASEFSDGTTSKSATNWLAGFKADNNGTVSGAAVDLSADNNYNQTVNAKMVYGAREDLTVKLNLVDAETGAEIATKTMTGKLATVPATNNTLAIPDDYTLLGTQPDAVRFKVADKTATYTGTLTADDTDDATVYVIKSSSLSKTISRDITYVVADGKVDAPSPVHQEVTYTTSGTVKLVDGKPVVTFADWTPDKPEFGAQDSPAVGGYVVDHATVGAQTVAAAVADADKAKIVDGTDQTVTYYNQQVTVTPEDPKQPGVPVDEDNPGGPKYPAGVDTDDLNQNVTRTIHYVDGKTDAKLRDDVVQTVKFTRTATVDLSNGAVTYTDWATDEKFAEAQSPDITGKMTTTKKVAEVTPTKTDSIETTVYYYDNEVTVTPDDPKQPGNLVDEDNPGGPKYPAGVDTDDLNQKVTRTIHYVDGKTGDPLHDDVVQTVKFTKTATVNLSNGAVKYTGWATDEKFAEAESPTIDGKMTTTKKVAEVTPNQLESIETTVYYYDNVVTVTPTPEPGTGEVGPKAPGAPVDEDNPTGPKYPAGVDTNDLTQTGTRTIRYVDGATNKKVAGDVVQKVHFTRTATVDLTTGKVTSYSKWTTTDGTFAEVQSPEIDGKMTATKVVESFTESEPLPIAVTVYYYGSNVTVTTTPDPEKPEVGPKTPGSLVDPKNPDGPTYPEGMDTKDLKRKGTRTIRYVDASTNKKVAKDVVQEIVFTRTATLDLAAGKIVGYSKWTTTDGTFAEVQSPEIDGKMTATKVVESFTESEPLPIAVTVYYYGSNVTVTTTPEPGTTEVGPKQPGTPVDPDNPDGPKYPEGVDVNDLTRTATRTIHYVDGTTGQKLADDVVQTISFTRTAKVDLATSKVTNYSKWTTADGTFAAVDSPEIDGKTTTMKTVEAVTETNPISITATVYYYGSDVTVTTTPDPDKPEVGPKQPHTPVDPDNPDGPKYPEGVDVNDLTRTVTRTIHYVDGTTGHKLADDVVQTIKFTRTAMVDLAAGKVTGYSKWTTTNGTFAKVDSPEIDGKTTAMKTVEAVTETNPVSITATVYYYGSDVTVTTTPDPDKPEVGPKQPHTPVDPDNTDGPKYPEGVDVNDLTRTATRTIHYVDAASGQKLKDDVVQTIIFTRTAKVDLATSKVTSYSKWTTADGTFAAVDSPEIDGKTTTMKTVEAVTETNPISITATVYYYGSDVTVTTTPNPKTDPDNPEVGPQDPKTPVDPKNPEGPKYPEGVDVNDLTRTVTRTIHYVDGVTGQKLADDVVQTITFTRTAKVDLAAGKVTGYSKWTTTDGTFAKVDSPAIDGKTTTTKTVEAVTETNPVSITATVYYYGSDVTVTTTPDPDKPEVGPKKPHTPVDPDNPAGPKYPEGVDVNDLTRTVTRTIHYVDGTTGQKLKDDVVQTITFTRTAKVDLAAGKVTGYSKWTTADGTFAKVDSPEIDGKTTTMKNVEAVTETNPISITATVYYYGSDVTVTTTPDPDKPEVGPKQPHTPVDPDNPDGPKYPEGVYVNDLTRTATRTIHYVDGTTGQKLKDDVVQTISFTRTAKVDLATRKVTNYSKWTTADGTFAAVDSPEIDGKTTTMKTVEAVTETNPISITATVYYYGSDVTVTTTPDPDKPEVGPKQPHTPVDPDNPDGPKYPEGVDVNDLTRTATRTIHYVDGTTGLKLADDVVQTIKFTRTATVDLAAGKVTGYSKWTTTDGTFAKVDSPAIDGKTTTMKTVEAVAETNPISITATVYYYGSDVTVTTTPEPGTTEVGPKQPGTPVDSDNPAGPKYPEGVDVNDLTRTVTRTIHYVDGTTGQKLADDVVQRITFTRTATVDLAAGKVTSYSKWITTDGTFAAVDSPAIDGKTTATKTVEAVTETNPVSITATVYYYGSDVTVTTTPDPDKPEVGPKQPHTPVDPDNPAGPRYPEGVDVNDLTRTVTRTIHYVDGTTGQKLADDVVQTIKFTRTATVDLAAGKVTGYSKWTTTDGTFAKVDSPEIAGKTTTTEFVAALTETTPAPITATVYYYGSEVVVTSTPEPGEPGSGPKQPGTPIDPENPDGPKYPAGVDTNDLNRKVTQTVNYRDAKTGQKVAGSSVQTLSFGRTATISFDAFGQATVQYGEWTPISGDTFAAVTSPTVTGLTPDRAVVEAMTETHPVDVTLNVYYYESAVTVTPGGPKQPDELVDPKNPEGPKYPDGVDADSLTRTVTRTIDYLDAKTGKTVAPSSVQTIKFGRTANVSFDQNGKAVVVEYGEWTPMSDNTFAEVISPAVAGMVADQQSVAAMTETQPAPTQLRVYYYEATATITPDQPKQPGELVDPNNPTGPRYSAGLTEADLNTVATRTITFVDENGEQLAEAITQTIKFTRTATVDFQAGTVEYGDWTTEQGSFAKVTSPEISGMTADQVAVPATTGEPGAVLQVEVVYHTDQLPLPDTSGQPGGTLPSTFGGQTNNGNQTNDGKKSTGKQNQTSKTDSARTLLPQTGNEHDSLLSALGLGLATMLGLFGLAKKRKRDEE